MAIMQPMDAETERARGANRRQALCCFGWRRDAVVRCCVSFRHLRRRRDHFLSGSCACVFSGRSGREGEGGVRLARMLGDTSRDMDFSEMHMVPCFQGSENQMKEAISREPRSTKPTLLLHERTCVFTCARPAVSRGGGCGVVSSMQTKLACSIANNFSAIDRRTRKKACCARITERPEGMSLLTAKKKRPR